MRAKIVKKAEDYLWSSAKVHVYNEKDSLLSKFHLIEEIDNWSEYLKGQEGQEELKRIRVQTQSGRPLGPIDYLRKLEKHLGRELIKRKPGPRGN